MLTYHPYKVVLFNTYHWAVSWARMSVLVCLRFTVSCQWNWGEIETERRKTPNLKSVKPLRAKNEIFPPFHFFRKKNTQPFWFFEALTETEGYFDSPPSPTQLQKNISTAWLFRLYGEMGHYWILTSFWGKYKYFHTNLLLKLLTTLSLVCGQPVRSSRIVRGGCNWNVK